MQQSMTPKPTRKFVLYEGFDGKPRSRWRNRRGPTVPGCVPCDLHGTLYPPPFRWIVRARTAKEACFFVNQNLQGADQGNSVGVLWDRNRDHPKPPPLGVDRTQYWAVVAFCRPPTITLWYNKEDAHKGKTWIDQTAICVGCRRHHEIVLMTISEAKIRHPSFWSGPHCSDPKAS